MRGPLARCIARKTKAPPEHQSFSTQNKGTAPPGPTAEAVALTVQAAPPIPGPTAAAVGGGPHGSGGPRPLGGRPQAQSGLTCRSLTVIYAY